MQLTDMSVLVVDDDEITLGLLQTHLRAVGVREIHVAVDGRDALRQLQALPRVDAIVLDLFMPDMDGLEFLQQLSQCRYAGLLVLSSSDASEIRAIASTIARDNGLRLAGNLFKPYRRQDLIAALTAPA